MTNLYCYGISSDQLKFCYTPHRQIDGKFYACKYRGDKLVKKVLFGKRKTADARAYKWYLQRKAILDARPKRSDSGLREIQKTSRQLVKNQTLLAQLLTEERDLTAQMDYWKKEFNKRKSHLKRVKKAIRKALKQELSLKQQLENKPNNGRVGGLI